ncbi:MAG TPA: xylulokinase [Candidatus Latescibacteria bacterium]|nr:xylulokinase [Candidatus Latescibacterota bacterium]
MPYLLGIDIGTTGAKTVLINEEGELISSSTVPYPLSTPHPNWAEQDPEDWWNGTVRSIKKVLDDAGIDPCSIAGLGLSGQMHSSVFLDVDNRVLRPAILWCDTRTEPQCRWIIEKVGVENLRQYVSNFAFEGFTAPKIIWLRENEPQIYSRVNTVLLPKDYIRFRLTGEIAMEVSDAAGTLLFDVRNRIWSEEILDKLDIPLSWFPRVYESIDVCGRVTREAEQLTGLKSGTPVVGGGADNTCGAVGTGIVKSGRVLSSIGTSGVIFAHTDEVKVDPQMRVHTFCHSVPEKWYLMGVVLSAGGSFRWFRDTIGGIESKLEEISGISSYEILTKEAEKVGPGSEGLIFLPYLMGERTPHRDANAKGVFFGITGRHTRGHLVRSVLEGITFAMRDSLEIIKGLGLQIDQIRATGGGAQSRLWQQLQADIYNAPVITVNTSQEGPAFGSAIMAGVGAGVWSNLEEATDHIIRITTETEPIEENVQIYNGLYEIFRSLYPRLQKSFQKVSQQILKRVI